MGEGRRTSEWERWEADEGLERVHVGCGLRFLLSLTPRRVDLADALPEGREARQRHRVQEE